MTQEEKELLLKDLCARLRYEVKCYPVITNGEPNTIGGYCEVLDDFYIREVGGWFPISMIKPYLRPMSSITEKEISDLQKINWQFKFNKFDNFAYVGAADDGFCSVPDMEKILSYLNKHYFDYCGLIEKNLALEAPKGMYNN